MRFIGMFRKTTTSSRKPPRVHEILKILHLERNHNLYMHGTCKKLPEIQYCGSVNILVRIRIRIRIFGSVHLTNGSGCGSGRLKNIRIRIRLRIRNTAEKPPNLQKSILIGIATIPVYASQQSTINVRDKKSLYFFRCEGKLRRIGNLKNLHAGKNCNFYQHGTSNNSPKCPTKTAEKYFLPVSLLYLQMHRNKLR